MQNGTSTTAGFQAHATGSRLHAGQGFCASPWHVIGTSRAGIPMPITVNADTYKLRFRWPEESSP